MSDKSIAFLAGGIDACALWRWWLPYLNLPGQHGYYYAFEPAKVLTHDYVGVQRLGLKDNLKAMLSLRSADMKIIYDLDDFLWDIPDWNPHAAVLRQIASGYTTCLHHADIVTVSTYPLKKAVLRHHKRDLINRQTGKEIPVVVVQNKIDMRVVAPRQQREGLIVGWAGSNTHDKDFHVVLPALLRIMREFPEVTFEFAGWMPPEVADFPNVRFRHWTPVSEWLIRFPRWGWDIALAPLYEHPFNNSKSGNKMTEAGSIGIPCLASYELPYSDWCKPGDPDLKYLLCTGEQSWHTKLRELIVDAERRLHYGKLMMENTRFNHSWNGGHAGWTEVISTLEAL